MNSTIVWQEERSRPAKESLRPRNATFREKLFSPSRRNISDWASNLSLLVSAHVPLVEAIKTSMDTTRDDRLKVLLRKVVRDMERGLPFGEALARFPAVFDGSFVQLIRSGENSGTLDAVLHRLAVQLTLRGKLYRKVQMALAYPLMIVVVSIGAIAFLLTMVVPMFAGMYKDFGASLPAATQLLIDSSDFVRRWFVHLLIAAVIGGILLSKVFANVGVRSYLDRWIQRVPVMGKLVLHSRTAKFCRTLGTLLENGVALEDGLAAVVGAANSPSMDRAVRKLSRMLRKGKSMSTASPRDSYFPALVVSMIAVGEETAQLDQTLLRTAEHYEAEMELLADALTSLIEPVVIVVLGVVLGAILIALYLPIFEMSNVVG
jgi:type IV pilus assembly protein PilC